ncbi:MAG: hypothetical protein U9N10_07060 [Bacillota bacterium]|nr:hypothetical protein [Bacillota bacterium]
MRKSTNNIEKLINATKVYKKVDDKVYHDAHLLLKIYSDVVWGMNESYNHMVSECQEFYVGSPVVALDIMTEFGSSIKAKLLQEQLEDIETSKVIIDVINNAMMKLKTYPKKGEKYYEILSNTYFVKKKYNEQELLEKLDISRTTYYRLRKKAICVFGTILWGYVLPEIIKNMKLETNLAR